MMSEILRKLNDDHYMGNDQFQALQEWWTKTGEMGVYKSLGQGIARENVYLIILCGDQMIIRSYRAESPMPSIALNDAEVIAAFADAIKVDMALRDNPPTDSSSQK